MVTAVWNDLDLKLIEHMMDKKCAFSWSMKFQSWSSQWTTFSGLVWVFVNIRSCSCRNWLDFWARGENLIRGHSEWMGMARNARMRFPPWYKWCLESVTESKVKGQKSKNLAFFRSILIHSQPFAAIRSHSRPFAAIPGHSQPFRMATNEISPLDLYRWSSLGSEWSGMDGNSLEYSRIRL